MGQRIWKIEKEVVVEDNIPVEKTFKTYYFFENYEEKYDITDSDNKELIQSTNYYFANGQRIAQRTNNIPESLEEVSYFHADHLGSAVRITDEAGKIIQSIAYTPFGKVAWFAGEDTTSYTYTDQEIDGSGFMYYDARYYDPDLGRFLQPDPMLDGMNRYTYCGNNPVRYNDPTGFGSEQPYTTGDDIAGGEIDWDAVIDALVDELSDFEIIAALDDNDNSGSGGSGETAHERHLRLQEERRERSRERREAASESSGETKPKPPTISNYDAGNDYMVYAGYLYSQGQIGLGLGYNIAGVAELGLDLSGAYGAALLIGSLVFGPAIASSPQVINEAGRRLFSGDEAIAHYGRHASQIMKVLGRNSYNLKNYINDANSVIRNGIHVPEMNGYIQIIGGSGRAKALFVGLKNGGANIATFHVKTISEISRQVPWIEY